MVQNQEYDKEEEAEEYEEEEEEPQEQDEIDDLVNRMVSVTLDWVLLMSCIDALTPEGSNCLGWRAGMARAVL